MFVKDMYHKTTPPDANQHGVVRAVLGKDRFFFFVWLVQRAAEWVY